jgi:hypothetical protein
MRDRDRPQLGLEEEPQPLGAPARLREQMGEAGVVLERTPERVREPREILVVDLANGRNYS